MRHVVPMLCQANYEIVERATDRLILRRGVLDLTAMLTQRGFLPQTEVTIDMTDCGDHGVTEVYGVAPQAIREGLARLAA
jgi:hypothetical protein